MTSGFVVGFRSLFSLLPMFCSTMSLGFPGDSILDGIEVDSRLLAMLCEFCFLEVSNSMAVCTENLALVHLFENPFFRISVVDQE